MTTCFAIPIRIDTPDRLRNLEVILFYLRNSLPDCQIIVSEQEKHPSLLNICNKYSAEYHFVQNDGAFNKSKSINEALRQRRHRTFSIYDSDVIVPTEALIKAEALIATNRCAVVLPYNQIFINVKGNILNSYLEDPNQLTLARITRISQIKSFENVEPKILQGGAMFFNGDVLEREGGFNQKMVGYGWEDTEIHFRLRKIGYYMRFIKEYSLVHLDHRRGPDSVESDLTLQNYIEFCRVKGLSKSQTRRYIDTVLLAGNDESSEQRARRRLQLDLDNRNSLASGRWRLHWLMRNISIRL